ncbi:hypothetical protein F5Y18DRAFT_123528 [Xylariaceae sp. FL1019]|nr:hypothetical protein F5Y18DRAFT_123528 [Xylariaceae sp. FL1019]
MEQNIRARLTLVRVLYFTLFKALELFIDEDNVTPRLEIYRPESGIFSVAWLDTDEKNIVQATSQDRFEGGEHRPADIKSRLGENGVETLLQVLGYILQDVDRRINAMARLDFFMGQIGDNEQYLFEKRSQQTQSIWKRTPKEPEDYEAIQKILTKESGLRKTANENLEELCTALQNIFAPRLNVRGDGSRILDVPSTRKYWQDLERLSARHHAKSIKAHKEWRGKIPELREKIGKIIEARPRNGKDGKSRDEVREAFKQCEEILANEGREFRAMCRRLLRVEDLTNLSQDTTAFIREQKASAAPRRRLVMEPTGNAVTDL